jgi:hypothetical protein
MALVDLWKKDPGQLAKKHIQQVISFAGGGKLADGSEACAEVREFLRNIPSELIASYVEQCLERSFEDSGFALQDLVNEVGGRLGFIVTPGRYRGTSSGPGNDGIWADFSKNSIVIEVKTTDAYRIDLDRVSSYRQLLARTGEIDLERSSMLIVVGREDTGGLEAQIRGSRHAWDMRLISVEALLRMLKLKEGVEDPAIVNRIHEILRPMEFTRLDPIVDIAFAAVEDIRKEEAPEEGVEAKHDGKKFTPVSFHAQCISRIEKVLNVPLVKHSRASFASSDQLVRVLCSVSRYHERAKRYWFAFHPYQSDLLSQARNGFVAFGCGSAQKLFLIPYGEFKPWLNSCFTTERKDGFYWHIQIRESGKMYAMTGRTGTKDFNISQYLLK